MVETARIAPFARLAAFAVVAALFARPIDAAEAPSVAASGRAPEATSRTLLFDVFLDDTPIGYHRFVLHPNEAGFTVEIEARFAWNLLGVKALDYDHHNREHWRDGCLVSIESKTRQNGKTYRVVGTKRGDRFELESQDGTRRLAGCVGTFAYWDRAALLRRKRLLNAQTGEWLAAETRALGVGRGRLGAREVGVDRFRIEGSDLAIELAYAADGGDWLALESPVLFGKKLRYRRALPPATASRSVGDHP